MLHGDRVHSGPRQAADVKTVAVQTTDQHTNTKNRWDKKNYLGQ